MASVDTPASLQHNSQHGHIGGLHFIGFNQDNTSLMIGTSVGYRLISWQDPSSVEDTTESSGKEVLFITILSYYSKFSLILIPGISY